MPPIKPPHPNDVDDWKETFYVFGYMNKGDLTKGPNDPAIFDQMWKKLMPEAEGIYAYQRGGWDAAAKWPNRGWKGNMSSGDRYLPPGRPRELRTWYTGGWYNASVGAASNGPQAVSTGQAYLTAVTAAEALAEWNKGAADYTGGITPPDLGYYDPVPGVVSAPGTPIPGTPSAVPAIGAGGMPSLLSTLLPLWFITSLTKKQTPAQDAPKPGTYEQGYRDASRGRRRLSGQSMDYNDGYDDAKDDMRNQPPALPPAPTRA